MADAEQERDEGELDRPRQHFQDFLDDRSAGHHARRPSRPEALRPGTSRIVRQIGLIEPEPHAHRLDGLAARLIAQDHLRRIAGHDPHQQEYEGEHRKQRDDGKGQPANEKCGHDHTRKAAARTPGGRAAAPWTNYFVKRVFSVIAGDRLSDPFSS